MLRRVGGALRTFPNGQALSKDAGAPQSRGAEAQAKARLMPPTEGGDLAPSTGSWRRTVSRRGMPPWAGGVRSRDYTKGLL